MTSERILRELAEASAADLRVLAAKLGPRDRPGDAWIMAGLVLASQLGERQREQGQALSDPRLPVLSEDGQWLTRRHAVALGVLKADREQVARVDATGCDTDIARLLHPDVPAAEHVPHRVLPFRLRSRETLNPRRL